jgi:hypothetical protein
MLFYILCMTPLGCAIKEGLERGWLCLLVGVAVGTGVSAICFLGHRVWLEWMFGRWLAERFSDRHRLLVMIQYLMILTGMIWILVCCLVTIWIVRAIPLCGLNRGVLC